MNISKEHIEELIFEYHEGNLSDSQKSELLNLIHQYPEYETDFALWAQTYAHVESDVPKYGLEAALLQKAPLAWYAHTWAKAGLASILVAIGIAGYWLLNSKKAPTIAIPTVQQIEWKKEEAKEAVSHITKPNKIIKNISPKRLNAEHVPEIQMQTDKGSTNSQEQITEAAKLEEVAKPAEETAKVLETEMAKPDTVLKTTVVELKKATEEKTHKKAKRKLPLNLKPSPDFLPVNPNF